MTEPKLSYLGPLPQTGERKRAKPLHKRIPWPFVLVVIVPTLLTALYYLLIASPRYVSETQFVVRASERASVGAAGGGAAAALAGIGLSTSSTDSYAVHQYLESRDAFREMKSALDLRAVLARPGADIFSRYPRPWEGKSDDGFYKGYKRFITVSYDSTTGISTLEAQGFTPRDAHALTEGLMVRGEAFVNRLNARSVTAGVRDAQNAVEVARSQLAEVQTQLTSFRNREGFIDPQGAAAESAQVIGNLLSNLAQSRAERAQVATEAPNSPQLPILDSRIRAFEAQVAAERAKLAGNTGSLAPRLRTYQDLETNREFAERELATATAALTVAEQEARRQRLYLDRITSPSIPDSPSEPKRWLSILTVLASSLVIYGIGWFVRAGVEEHRQD